MIEAMSGGDEVVLLNERGDEGGGEVRLRLPVKVRAGLASRSLGTRTTSSSSLGPKTSHAHAHQTHALENGICDAVSIQVASNSH